MKSKVYWAFGLLFAVSVVLSACAAPGAPAAPAYSVAPTAVPPTAAPANPPTTGGGANAPMAAATLMVAKDAALGQFLADEKGMALYLFTKDDKNVSNCYDKCATAWPPLLSAGQPKGLDGINAALLGTTQRKDGMLQVIYNGYPLYYYAKDEKPGDVKGQGVGDAWYVLSASGEMIKGSASAAPAAPSSQQDTGSVYK
jgi:predicted lipoprotein with Yx(FWY)xxD motif